MPESPTSPPGPEACPLCGGGPVRFAAKALLHAGCERDLFACGACGAGYYWPVPPAEEIARCYPPAYFDGFLKQYWKDHSKGRLLAEELTSWRREGSFLDVGCALGTMLKGVADHSGWSVKGLEYSPEAAALGNALNGLEIFRGGLLNAPWEDGSLDYVHVNNVLEHESRPVEALAAAARLLSKGGRLHITLPNGSLDIRPNIDLYRKWGRAVVTRHGGHLFFFSRRSLEILMEKTGLRLLGLKSFHFKTGLKARGLTPRAYRMFRRPPSARSAKAAAQTMSAETARTKLGPRPNWPWYRLRAKLRRLWRWPGVDWGCDYELLAEKV